MKKLNKIIFSSIAVPTCALFLMPLVACGNNKEQVITPIINLDQHISKVECSTIKKNNDFTVELVTTDSGWRQIDKSSTTILVDDKQVGFTLVNNTKLKVAGSVVNGSKVEINLVAGKSLNQVWAGLDTTTQLEGKSLEVLHVGDKIEVTLDETSPKGLDVWLLYGTYSKIESENDWREAAIGSENNHYKVYDGSSLFGGKDITETFKTSGYTFTTADLKETSTGKHKPLLKTFDIVYTLVDEYGATKITNCQTSAVIANRLIADQCSIAAEKTEVEQGASTWMKATVNDGAIDLFTYTIESDPNNTGSTIEYGEFKAGSNATGTVTIKGTSCDKVSGVSITKTTTINVIAPTSK